MNLAIDEEGKHLLRRHLIIKRSIAAELLYGETIIDNMCVIDNRILHKHIDAVAKQLLILIPHDRIMIECETRVERVVYKRIAYGLNISTIGTYMMETEYLTINRIGLDIVCYNLESVGMHKERVALRIVNSHSTISTEGKACILPVFAIVTGKFVLIYRVNINHIAESLTESVLAIVIHTVANQHLAFVRNYRAVH